MDYKKLISNNFSLKVTALLLALFVWIMISGRERAYSETTMEVNVEYVNAAENIDVRYVNPEKVRIKVKGTSKEIQGISPENVKLKIDLEGTRSSTKLNRFAMDYLEYPESLQIESIYPQWIELTIEEFDSKMVNVKVTYTGKLQPGIRLTNRTVSPHQVKIFGYKSQISRIQTVQATENIDLSEITSSQTVTLQLEKAEEILRFEDTDTIKVNLVVENKNVTRTQ